MIYPSEVGTSNEHCHLNTLDRIWVQGKIKMWVRWSTIGGGSCGNMFNQILSTQKISKDALNKIIRELQKSGTTREDLLEFFQEMLNGNNKSYLAFCTDEEACKIDKAVGQTLSGNLINLLHEKYRGKGRSIRSLAEEMQAQHPELSFMTCRRRIDTWLKFADYSLFQPLSDAFDKNKA